MPPRRPIKPKKKNLPSASDPIESAINSARNGGQKSAQDSETDRENRRGNHVLGNGVFVDTIPIVWNPGVHHTVLHQPGVVGVPGGTPFKGSLRMFMAQASTAQAPKRFGFQFHYNPATIAVSYSLDSGVVPNATDAFDGNLYAHLQTITMTLLLNRQAEMAETNPKAVSAPCTAADLVMLKKFGTMYDLDFLWGAINWATTLDANTGVTVHDIGYLQANVLMLTLGRNWKFPVIMDQANVTHTKFSPDMVPIMTQLDVSMTRMSAQNSKDHTLDLSKG